MCCKEKSISYLHIYGNDKIDSIKTLFETIKINIQDVERIYLRFHYNDDDKMAFVGYKNLVVIDEKPNYQTPFNNIDDACRYIVDMLQSQEQSIDSVFVIIIPKIPNFHNLW